MTFTNKYGKNLEAGVDEKLTIFFMWLCFVINSVDMYIPILDDDTSV